MMAPWRNERVKQLIKRPEIRASLEIVLSVVMIAILLLVALRPTLTTVATLQKKIDDQDVVDRKLKQKINQLTKAQSDLSSNPNLQTLVNTAVPDDNDQQGMVKRVTLLAQENQLEVKSVTWGAVPIIGNLVDLTNKDNKENKGGGTEVAKSPTGAAIYEIAFDIRGTQSNVFGFLNALENMDRLVKLTTVDMKKEEDKDASTGVVFKGLRVTGRAIAYYLPPKK